MLLLGGANSGNKMCPEKSSNTQVQSPFLALYLLVPMSRNLCHSSWCTVRDSYKGTVTDIPYAFPEHLHRNSLSWGLLSQRLLSLVSIRGLKEEVMYRSGYV